MQSLIFFGSDRYSVAVLQKLESQSDIKISTIVSTADYTPAAKYAASHGITLTIYSGDIHIPDGSIGLSASFPRIFPPSVIKQFDGSLYNLHPSLLPQYRNVSPVPYALAMGDKITGISLFRISEGIDNGEVVAQTKIDIDPSDTTPILLDKLFAIGADLFTQFVSSSQPLAIEHKPSTNLIFTQKLTRESGHIEWKVIQKLIKDEKISVQDTENPLIKLRLTHFPDRSSNILSDLIRALDGYEKVWTTAPTTKGNIDVSFVISEIRDAKYDIRVLIPGKPRPISWNDFSRYYLKV